MSNVIPFQRAQDKRLVFLHPIHVDHLRTLGDAALKDMYRMLPCWHTYQYKYDGWTVTYEAHLFRLVELETERRGWDEHYIQYGQFAVRTPETDHERSTT